jgi:hypothetical protein
MKNEVSKAYGPVLVERRMKGKRGGGTTWPQPFLFPHLMVLLAVWFVFAQCGLVSAAPITSALAVKVQGEVNIIMPDGQKVPVAEGAVVSAGQVVDCGPESRLLLEIGDGSQIEILEGTRIEVNNLLPQEESKFSLSLFFGRIAAKLKRIVSADIVITPTMVAGVRGTDFLVTVADDGASVLSVSSGQVQVSSDSEGVKSPVIDIKPGEEIQVDELGAVLTAHPVKLDTLEAYQAFRKQRLLKLKESLPAVVDQLEQGVDKNLGRLEQIKAMPYDRAEILKKLDADIEALRPDQAAERAKLTIKAYMQASDVLSLVRDFRIQRMRLRTVFAQSERLKEVLPLIAEPLGADYKAADQGLARILTRQKEVREKEQLIAQQFEAVVTPIQPIIEKFKQRRK